MACPDWRAERKGYRHKGSLNLDFFKAHYEEVMAMREQIILIKNMLSALNETQKETTNRSV